MNGYISNIEQLTLANNNFRRVLYTTPNSQLVLMTLRPGEEIGEEVHNGIDQFFRIEAGKGKVIIDGMDNEVENGSAMVVPAGTKHNILNIGTEPLRLYTVYTPPHHRDGTVHATKEAADSDHEEFDGQTTK